MYPDSFNIFRKKDYLKETVSKIINRISRMQIKWVFAYCGRN